MPLYGGSTSGPGGGTTLLRLNNLSDVSNVATSRTNLGLADMAVQSPDAVGITGGTITGVATPSDPGDVTNKAYVDSAQAVVAHSQTGPYTLTLTDQSAAVEVTSASSSDVTVPPNSSVAFPIGTVVEVTQLGLGTVSLIAGAGVTLRSRGGLLSLAGQYAVASMRKQSADVWLVTGDLA